MKFIHYIVFLILTLEVFSQNFGNLKGFVTDSLTGEALPFSNLIIDAVNLSTPLNTKYGASTDANGYFVINSVPANTDFFLIATYVGYETQKIKINIPPNKTTQFRIRLKPINLELQTIEKIADRIPERNKTDIGLQKFTPKQMESFPKGVETDIFRSLQYIPGVQSTSDISARYYVRGGSSDQNLVLLNGSVIYNPFHALGLFSVVDPDMINSIEFYKGGFPAEYSGRVSSVLDVYTKDGNKNFYSFKGSTSYMTGKGLIEGPIPYGSFISTFRKSYSNKIIDKFLKQDNIPIDFYDFSFKLNYSNPDILEDSKFTVFGFSSGDKIDYKNEMRENFNWDNKLFNISWLQFYDSPIFSELSISYSTYSGEILPNLSDSKQRKNDLTDFTLKMDVSYVQDNKDQLDIGVHFKAITVKLFTYNQLGVQTNYDNLGGNFAVYGQYKLLRFDNLGLDLGSRINLTSISNKGGFFIEPRASITYVVHPMITLKAAYGIFQQEIVTITDEDEVITLFEPWMIVPDYLTPPRSTHYIAGIDLFLTYSSKIKVEAFYKKTDNLPMINKEKIFENDPDLLNGNGESSGIEFSFNHNNTLFNFNLSYTFIYSYKELNNVVFYPKYDTRHSGNVFLEIMLPYNFSTSIAWLVSSGLPFTQMIGYYDKFYLNNPFNPIEYYQSTPFLVLANKNLGRLPYYHRLDITLSKKFEFYGIRGNIDFSVLNVYNRKNIFYFKRDTGERVNMLPFLPTATLRLEI